MPLNITEEIKQRIIDSNDIVDVIEEFLPLKKSGTNYMTNCPFHKEKTPSFVVSKQKQIYHCFGCGKNGNVISFIMEYKNLTYIETIEYLADRAGIKLEQISYSKEAVERNNLENRLYQINKDAAYYFYNNIQNSQQAVDYLAKRQIDQNIIKSFGIGYTVNEWDRLLNYLKSKGYTEDDIAKTGLIIKSEKAKKYYDRFRNRIMFPIVDVKKRIIGFGGRVMDDTLPKYVNSPDSMIFNKGYNLYGLNIAKQNISMQNIAKQNVMLDNVKDKSFYLVEGYMDVIKMHVYGFNTAVAALGTSLTENQIKLLKRYSNSFYICFDSDNAGMKAALRAINMFKKNNLDAKVITLKGAKDPDELLNKYGKTRFEMLVADALDYYSFLDYYYKDDFNSSNKMTYIYKFFENLVNVNSDIEKELTIEKLSLKVGVSKESLMNEFRKKYYKNNNDKPKSYVSKEKIPNKILTVKNGNTNTSHEEELIKLIFKDNSLALKLNQIINDVDFSDYEYRDIFVNLYQKKLDGLELTREYLSSIIDNKLSTENIFKDFDETEFNINSLFNDCYIRLEIKYLESLRNNKNNKLTKINDEAIQRQEMQDISRLAKRIKSLKEEVC